MAKKVHAIIQARMGSTRLPGKVMMRIEGTPILGHIVDRLSQVEAIDTIIVATSVLEQDDPVEAWCALKGIPCIRGSEENVLDRFRQAAVQYPADVYIRATGDNPMVDIRLVRQMLDFFDDNGLSYTCYKNYPIGSGVEIFTAHALEEAVRCAELPFELEHVTPYMYQRMTDRKVAYYVSDVDDSGIRMTVDTEEDLRFARALFARLYREHTYFGIAEIKELLSHEADLADINRGIHQKTLGE